MTISEQLREAALYEAKPLKNAPVHNMIVDAFTNTSDWCQSGSVHDRTFILLVAEALE